MILNREKNLESSAREFYVLFNFCNSLKFSKVENFKVSFQKMLNGYIKTKYIKRIKDHIRIIWAKKNWLHSYLFSAAYSKFLRMNFFSNLYCNIPRNIYKFQQFLNMFGFRRLNKNTFQFHQKNIILKE